MCGYGLGYNCIQESSSRKEIQQLNPLSHSILIHSVPVAFQALHLLAGKLSQQVADNLRGLVRLLLHLTLPDSVERAEQPHFLQVADESLEVFGGFDLCFV